MNFALRRTSPSKNPATKLQFKRRPEPIEIIEGDSTVLEFECAGDTGDDVQYKWYKDGLNVSGKVLYERSAVVPKQVKLIG